MKKIIIFVIILAVVIFFVFRKKDREPESSRLGAPTSSYTEDGRPLFALEEKDESLNDFAFGGEYLVGGIQSPERFVFQRYQENEQGLLAVFLDEQGNEQSFGSAVLFSVAGDSDFRRAKKLFENDEAVLKTDFLPLSRVIGVSYAHPYEAYIQYLRYVEDDLFVSVSLDFTVSTMHNTDIAL